MRRRAWSRRGARDRTSSRRSHPGGAHEPHRARHGLHAALRARLVGDGETARGARRTLAGTALRGDSARGRGRGGGGPRGRGPSRSPSCACARPSRRAARAAREKRAYQDAAPAPAPGRRGQGAAPRRSRRSRACRSPRDARADGARAHGRLAVGWLGTSFTPEHADAHLAHLRRGAERRRAHARRASTSRWAGVVGFGEDVERMVAAAEGAHGLHARRHGLGAHQRLQTIAYRRGGSPTTPRPCSSCRLDAPARGGAARVPDAIDPPDRTCSGPRRWCATRAPLPRRGSTTLRLDPLGETPRRAPRHLRPRRGARAPGAAARDLLARSSGS